MNVFRLLGDIVHLMSLLVLIYKIHKSKNCHGLSCKTQELYLLVFVTRYLDLFLYIVSFYNTFMKVAFIASTIYIIHLMKFRKPYNTTYDPVRDSFPHFKYLVPSSAILALIFNNAFEPFEIVWTFSIYLEAVSIIPQLTMLQKMRNVENLTANYVFLLGAYRMQYYTEGFYCLVSIGGGIVQSLLYADFFYYYIKAIREGKHVTIPI